MYRNIFVIDSHYFFRDSDYTCNHIGSFMKKKGIVSPSEFKVMEILWASSPLSASQIIQELEEVESWHGRTTKSLINRLLKKNIIGFKQDGVRYLYYPLIKKNDYLQKTSISFVKRLFGGRVSPLVAHFAKKENISKEDIREIRAILDELDPND